MKVVWDLEAMLDRHEIFDYIELDNFDAAVLNDDKIEDSGFGLQAFPLMGRVGKVEGTREFVIPGLPYVLIYEVNEETIRIVRVLHGAQMWPAN